MKSLLKYYKIDALIPVYINGIGNCTEIIINDESHMKSKTVETCIKNLADYYNISLYHNRINYGQELGITNKVPIVINENLIYIYINVRKPMFDHDSAYGYINYYTIDDVFEQNNYAAIKMKCGRVIQTRQSINVTKKSMLYARLAKDIYKEKNHL
ncbi:MAG: hypothetical protein PHT02_11980 [Tissierellia bacterium]|nr:hypothetical protein [Tissierellia bacterium]